MNLSLMRCSRLAPLSLLFGLLGAPRAARAEVVFYDKDDWKVYTTGRAEGHYQLILGDGDPISTSRLVGGQIQNTGSEDNKNKLFESRIRSGFVSTQIGFGVQNQLMPGLMAEAFIGAWLAGIDSGKTPPQSKAFDVRDGWGALTGGFGRFLFGRAFSIFGSASGGE